MANESINLVNLDFNSLKASLKEHLSGQAAFQDYDFDGSNMSVLLDLLSYNTYINSFYLNMVASEMFLDSAQLRDSVISHAKTLNYTPRSFRSATARINIAVTPSAASNTTTVTIPRGTSFTSKVGSNTYTFTLPDNHVITGSTNGVFRVANVEIKEGLLLTDTFIYNGLSTNQRFILSNPTIDTTSLRVYVTENNGSNVLTYVQANSYLNIDSASQVFFLQSAENDLYELVFGNGAQGREPSHGAAVSAVYGVGNGELPNGCALFSSDDSIDSHTNVAITTVSTATGGLVHETTQSIRKNAPRYFQTQERAVNAADYKTLLQLAYPEINAIHVYGGEEENPPRYGKVVISLDIANSDGVSESNKAVYQKFLKERCPLTIDPVFIDPEYIGLEVYSIVTYNTNTITASENDLVSAVKTKIRIFNEQNLNDFNTTFRYSKLVETIDGVDISIISNGTEVIAYKALNPALNNPSPFTVRFHNKLKILNSSHAITSTYFTYDGALCQLRDDGNGIVNIVSLEIQNGEPVLNINVGTVDYTTGTVFINGLNISSYEGPYIKMKAVTDSYDIDAMLNNIIRIKDEDIFVTASGIRQ
jgi:hypothetical protein